MEELEKLKKKNKTIFWIDLFLLILIITIIIIALKYGEITRFEYKPITPRQEIFNSKFYRYIGKNINSKMIEELIKEVEEANKNNLSDIKHVSINGMEQLDFKIDKNSTYSVEVEFSENGYINNLIIKENYK